MDKKELAALEENAKYKVEYEIAMSKRKKVNAIIFLLNAVFATALILGLRQAGMISVDNPLTEGTSSIEAIMVASMVGLVFVLARHLVTMFLHSFVLFSCFLGVFTYPTIYVVVGYITLVSIELAMHGWFSLHPSLMLSLLAVVIISLIQLPPRPRPISPEVVRYVKEREQKQN